ncbi:unnamed protein product [Absidia cylindrospora]
MSQFTTRTIHYATSPFKLAIHQQRLGHFIAMRKFTTDPFAGGQSKNLHDIINAWADNISSQRHIAHDTITASPLNLLANTLDEATVPYKHTTLPTAGTIVPATWHHIYFPPRTVESSLAHDGYESEFFPPAPFTQRMWAGATLTFNHHHHPSTAPKQPLSVGDTVTMATYLDRCEFRPSSRLGDAVFVYLNKDIYRTGRKHGDLLDLNNSNGSHDNWVMREQRCLVYATEQAESTPMKSIKVRKTPDFSMVVKPSPVQIFRYSALTFNAHRIHYDQQYTQTQEHHPACLVQGPLSSTWMISLLRTYLSSEHHLSVDSLIDSFDYRCLAPLYVDQPLTVCGRRSGGDGSQFDLWITNHTQHLAVKGSVTLKL